MTDTPKQETPRHKYFNVFVIRIDDRLPGNYILRISCLIILTHLRVCKCQTKDNYEQRKKIGRADTRFT